MWLFWCSYLKAYCWFYFYVPALRLPRWCLRCSRSIRSRREVILEVFRDRSYSSQIKIIQGLPRFIYHLSIVVSYSLIILFETYVREWFHTLVGVLTILAGADCKPSKESCWSRCGLEVSWHLELFWMHIAHYVSVTLRVILFSVKTVAILSLSLGRGVFKSSKLRCL